MATSEGMGWGMMENGGWRKGPWTTEEDRLLIEYVKVHGEGRWNSVARLTGLRRNGKSCRLRWVNYLRPDLKRGQITPHEESIILELHAKWGNRWSTIARSLPGRTDNEIKNYWRTHFKKRAKASTNDNEISKTRLLRKQQFQQQQFQYQQQQQLQQPLPTQYQQQFTTMDMKKIISILLDDSDNKVLTGSLPHARHEEVASNMHHPTTASFTTDQEQGVFYSVFSSDISTSEGSNDDLLWDGFWNIDDVQGTRSWSAMCATGKVGLHSVAAPLC